VVAPAASVVAIPAGAGLEQAATLPMNGLTALRGLEMLGLAAGDTLAVTGAAGLLGASVIRLAREQGRRVIADAAPADEDLVRSVAPDVIVSRSDDFAAAVRAVVPGGVAGVRRAYRAPGRGAFAARTGGRSAPAAGGRRAAWAGVIVI
jgi:NADPH2:quinone reductase